VTRKFAEGTEVPVARSRGEIEALVEQHGATKFMSFFEEGRAVIAFGMKERLIRFTIALPGRDEERFTRDPRATWRKRSTEAAEKAYKAEERRIWRALLLVIKAKLEAVQSEITTFEQEFLPFIVLADGQTVGDTIIPQLGRSPSSLDITRMLPAPTREEH
jgi:hypothetical protein